jgi:hypothetical protein
MKITNNIQNNEINKGNPKFQTQKGYWASLTRQRGPDLVIDDRTRSVVQGAYWTLIGRWHCRVRSFLQCVRSLCCCALLRLTSASGHSWDQHVRSFPARPVYAMSASGRCFTVSRWATGASGQLDQRVRSVLRYLAVVRPARPISMTSASGQCDQRVRSV